MDYSSDCSVCPHSVILPETATRHTHVLTNYSGESTGGAKTRIFVAIAVLLLAALYLTNLTRMGMYSTDEPRYADIGRAMAQSGDWITPRLWGQPWFEKPALLYWMTATGFRLGLGPDLAPRLSVALLSLIFLWLFHRRLTRIFGLSAAGISTAILATSAGWLAYSHVAVTDLPLSAFFSLAVLWSITAESEPEPPRLAAAIALALAVLAKGLPPIVLFLPVLALDYCNWKRWFVSWPLPAFALVALPWYVLCTWRNGWAFPYTFFIQHQLDRFRTDALQHVQPWWFYIPVFLLLLFPWFPLLPLAFRHTNEDRRLRTLAAVAGFGFLFFSASVNKLPGYVLPLVPVTCVMLGVTLARMKSNERWMIAPIGLLGALVAVAALTPESVAHLRAAVIPWQTTAEGVALAALAGAAISRWGRDLALPIAVVLAAAGFLWVEMDLFPVLDAAESARSLWISGQPACAPVLPRGMSYSLYYYAGKALPDCGIVDKKAITPRASGRTK